MVEQIANNNDQTSQVASFGKGIKEIDLQDNPPIHAFPQETQMPWIHLQLLGKATTEAEKEKCKKEGQCFKCGKQGHLAKNCPDQKPRAQTTVTEKSDTASIATAKFPTPAKIAGFLNQFSTSDKEEFVKSMRELGEDVGFQEA
jgi:Zinc knuckle